MRCYFPLFASSLPRYLGMPAVMEKILRYLDHKSLCRLQQVCKSWNEAVNDGHLWKYQLQRKVSIMSIKPHQPLQVDSLSEISCMWLIVIFLMQVSGDIVWKEINQQLPGVDTETEPTEKEKYGIIYRAAQVRFQTIYVLIVFYILLLYCCNY